MEESGGIVHYRFRENESPKKIPDLSPFSVEKYVTNKDFFIELVNMKEVTIGLFFFLDWLAISHYEMKTDHWLDFANRYDEINAGESEMGYWQSGWVLDNLADRQKTQTYDRSRLVDYATDYGCESTYIHGSQFGEFSMKLISYGRLVYPFGLKDDHKKVYQQVLTEDINNPQETTHLINEIVGSIEERQIHFEESEDYPEEPTDGEIGEALDIEIEIWGNDKLFVPEVINLIVRKMEVEFYRKFADRFFTKENIDLFINASIAANRTDLTAFLLEYKNNHFPIEGDLS